MVRVFLFSCLYGALSAVHDKIKSQFAQNLERKCSDHVISVTHLFFINYFLYLITSLCPCGFLLVQMCWARFPPVPDLAEPLHRTLSQVPAEDWLHCHILSEPQTVSPGSSLGPHIHLNGSLVLLWPTCIILLWAT